MVKVSSSQFNYTYNNETRFPYSIGCLVAYLKTKSDLAKKFEFQETFVFRNKVQEYIERSRDSDIFIGSCYAWNWEITKFLAEEIKKINPECLIVLGGPQVPNHSDKFFEKHPYVDIIVHGEGEYILANIFEEYLKDRDFSKIKGLERWLTFKGINSEKRYFPSSTIK